MFLWPFVAELWPCSQCHVTHDLMKMFTVVDLVSCFSTSRINLSIRADWNAYDNESSAIAGLWTRSGHMTLSCMTSSQVTKTFRSVTPHRIEVEPRARCLCVCLVETHRLICNMTYLGHLSGQVIWPGVRSIFEIDLSRSKCTCYDAS